MKFRDLELGERKMVTKGDILNWQYRKQIFTIVLPPNVLVKVSQLETPHCQTDKKKKKSFKYTKYVFPTL